MATSIGSLALKITADGGQFAAALKKAEGPLMAFAGKVGQVGLGLAHGFLGGDILDIARAIPGVGPALVAIKELVAVPLQLAAGAETARLRFAALFGDMETGKKALAEIKALALASGFGIDQLEPAARALAGAGVEADKLVPTLRALAGYAAVSGDSVEELAGHLARVVATGHLSSRELKQFLFILPQLAQNLGVTQQQLRGMVEAGAIGPRELLKALGDATQQGGKFADSLANRAKSLQGSWDILGIQIKGVAAAFGSVVASGLTGKGGGAGVFDALKAGIESLRPAAVWLGDFFATGWSFYRQSWEDFGQPVFDKVKELLGDWKVEFPKAGDVALFAIEMPAKGIAYLWASMKVAGGGFIWLGAKAVSGMAFVAEAARRGLDVLGDFAKGVFEVAAEVGNALVVGLVKPLGEAISAMVGKLVELIDIIIDKLPAGAVPDWVKNTRDAVAGFKDDVKKIGDVRFVPPNVDVALAPMKADLKAAEGWLGGLAAAWGNVSDKLLATDIAGAAKGIDAWFAKVKAGAGAGAAAALANPNIDLGAGLEDAGKDKFKTAEAAVQGSKEAASIIAKFQAHRANDQFAKDRAQRAELIELGKAAKKGIEQVNVALRAANQVRQANF